MVLLVMAAAFVLYGVFALLYGGDGSSATYVTLAGYRLNAHLAAAISFALGVALTLFGRSIIRATHARGVQSWTNPPTRR